MIRIHAKLLGGYRVFLEGGQITNIEPSNGSDFLLGSWKEYRISRDSRNYVQALVMIADSSFEEEAFV